MNRKRYTQEFKLSVVKEVQEVGNAAQVARRHDITASMIYRWMKQSKYQEFKQTRSDGKKVATFTPTLDEYQAIEEENDKLKRILGEKDLEIEILRDLVKKGRPNLSQKIEVAYKWIGLGYSVRTVLRIVGVLEATWYARKKREKEGEKPRIQNGGRPQPGYSLNQQQKRSIRHH